MQQRRDKNGKIKDSLISKIKNWILSRQIRKGKAPRGRTSQEVISAIDGSIKGCMAEIWGILSISHFRPGVGWVDHGVVSVKKVTTAFRDYIVDSLQNSATYPLSDFKYHACGTGIAAEANTDTQLGTEVETRSSGTQVEGASANIYKSVATIAMTGTRAITEHGLFSASSSGTLLDRSKFDAINVINGDSIQFTYEVTFSAEA